MNFKTEEIAQENILAEVIEGLSKSQKKLPSKLFYDEKGSILFDKICELEEYYPTRTETKIMSNNIEEITNIISKNSLLIELGSGSSIKIRMLLEHLFNIAGYVPIDISAEHLSNSVAVLQSDYPDIDIYPLAADYTKFFELPEINKPAGKKVAFYPGSTIGNFTPKEAKIFLSRIAKIIGKDGGLLIGVDLKKDKLILDAAYNDKKGITAQFNLNILERLNNEIEADFNVTKFKHHAFYNEEAGRIEMHLISTEQQTVQLNDYTFNFNMGENILTEYSYKYSLDEFASLVSDDYKIKKAWTDKDNLFSVQYFEVK